MSLVRRAFDAEYRSTLAEPDEGMWEAWVAPSWAGQRVSVPVALSMDTVWGCVTLLARSIAQMPLIVYQGEGRDRQRAKGAWQWNLLHESPNPTTAPDVLVEQQIRYLNTWGNWYAEKVKGPFRNREIVGELWTIPANKVTVETDRLGAKHFQIEGESKTLTSSEILHIPGFGYDGVKGLSPITMHRKGLAAIRSRQSWSADVAERAGRPGGILSVAQKLSQEAAERLKSRWDAAHSGKNRGGTAVLEEGATWTAVEMSHEDQQYIDQERFSVAQVCRIFQVPPEKVGGERASSNTYANVASANLDFIIFSLQHWMVRVEQGLKHDPDLFPPGLGLYPEFLAEGLLRGDPEARVRFYEGMSKARAITVNEIRERENLSPVPWGDEEPKVPGQTDLEQPDDEDAAPDPSANGNGRVPVVA